MGINVLFQTSPSRSPVARLSVVSLMIAIVASLASAGPSLGATPFHNGSFEHGNYYDDPASWQVVDAGRRSVNGWTVTQGSIDWVNAYWQAADGGRSIDLNGNNPGAMSQTFSTIPKAAYKVTFSLSGNPESGPANKTMTIDVGGTARGFAYNTAVRGNSFSDMKYINESYSFVAQPDSNATTVRFTSTTPGNGGVVLDDIVVTPTARLVFNARKDFELSPSQANPSGAWSYRETHSDGTRRLLTHFDTSLSGTEGMEAWTDNNAYLSWPWVPAVWYNNSGHDVSYMPADGLFVHPSVDHAIVISWKSPGPGWISIDLTLTDRDAGGGNGVGWTIAKLRHLPAASGTIANGGSTQASVAHMNVREGDRIDLKVNALHEQGWDTTQVELEVTFWPTN